MGYQYPIILKGFSMTTLLKCGEFLPDDADICPTCGMEIERDIVRCGQCGSWIPREFPACKYCMVIFEMQKPPEDRGWFRKKKEGIYRLTVEKAFSSKDFERYAKVMAQSVSGEPFLTASSRVSVSIRAVP